MKRMAFLMQGHAKMRLRFGTIFAAAGGSADRRWSRPLSRAVERATVRTFSANGSDAVLREFAVARYDRKIIGKRGRDDDSIQSRRGQTSREPDGDSPAPVNSSVF